MDHAVFLNALFEHKPDDALILIWTLKGKRSKFCKTVIEATEYVAKHNQNVYVGAGLSPKDYGPRARCKADQIIGIPGLFADIDIAGPAHKKKNLPPTIEDALSLVKSIGLEPSLIINSGNGIWAWWLFKEVWSFDSDEEREEAAALCRRLHATIQARAQEQGWVVDAVHDLARVARIPGTQNIKGKRKVTARILHQSKVRHEPPVFDEFLLPDPGKQNAEHEISKLQLNPQASPPWEKINLLLQIAPRLEATWWDTRNDLSSASEGDLSLANYGVQLGLSDQETANLIIAWRRLHGHDLKKAMRQDYMASTILKARASHEHRSAEEEFETAAHLRDSEYETPETREAVRESISKVLGVEIKRILRFMSEEPSYLLIMNGGEVMLPTVADLIEPQRLRRHIAKSGGRYVQMPAKGKWPIVANQLLRLCEDIEVSPEATDVGETEAWLSDYLETVPMCSLGEGAPDQCPFVHSNHWHIFLEPFHRWVVTTRMVTITQKDIQKRLRRCGCKRQRLNVKIGSRRTTRRVWILPGTVETDDEAPRNAHLAKPLTESLASPGVTQKKSGDSPK